MSKGPTLTGETCLTATRRIYLNVSFSREDWCKYKSLCRIDDLLPTSIDVCLLCKHRIPLDIPTILNKKHAERAHR